MLYNNFRRAAASSSSTVHGQDVRKQQIAQWVDSVLQNEISSSSAPLESPMLQDHNFSISNSSILGFSDDQVGGTVRLQKKRACYDPFGNVEHIPQFVQPPQQQHGQFPHPQINGQFSQLPQHQHGHFIQHQQEYGQFLQHQANGQFLHQPPQQQYGQFIQKQQQQHEQYVQQQENGKFRHPQGNAQFPQQQQQQLAKSVQPVNQTGTCSSSSESSESELPMLHEYCVSSSRILHSPNNCDVCGDVRPLKNGKEPGLAYEAIACNSCQQFFKRSENWQQDYKCKDGGFKCSIGVENRRKSCQWCRIKKCFDAGMKWPPIQQQVHPPCRICGGTSSKLGCHFGVVNCCEGCKCFFIRTKASKAKKPCTCKDDSDEMCGPCRYQNCLEAGMDRTKIKRGRPSQKQI